MVILVWILALLITTVVVEEICFRSLRKNKFDRIKIDITNPLESNDRDIGVLQIETPSTAFIPKDNVALRDSWRLSLDSTMDAEEFSALRDDEYSKKL